MSVTVVIIGLVVMRDRQITSARLNSIADANRKSTASAVKPPKAIETRRARPVTFSSNKGKTLAPRSSNKGKTLALRKNNE